jgi:hypothetical protein
MWLSGISGLPRVCLWAPKATWGLPRDCIGLLKLLKKLINVPKGLLRCCLDYFGYLGPFMA